MAGLGGVLLASLAVTVTAILRAEPEPCSESGELQTVADLDPGSPGFLPRLGDCGLKGDAQFVIGGNVTKPGEFPWAVLLGNKRVKTRRINGMRHRYNETRWSCGGILINQWFVLTAAHCQGKRRRGKINLLRLGEWNVAGELGEDKDPRLAPEQDFIIGPDDVIIHEDYDTIVDDLGKNDIVNDIALIRLPRKAELNDGVQLVCLPHTPTEYRKELKVCNLDGDITGMRSTVVGWGFTTPFDLWSDKPQGDIATYGIASREQMKAGLPVLNSPQCLEAWDREPGPGQLCAGGVRGVDSCNGDSGGGLYIQKEFSGADDTPWYLLAIVSFGSKVCGLGKPGMYSRVEHFIPWILRNIQ